MEHTMFKYALRDFASSFILVFTCYTYEGISKSFRTEW